MSLESEGESMRYFFSTIASKAYWQYVLFSRAGGESVFAILGFFYLLVESLDFFEVYTRDSYAPWAFLVFLILSVVISILFRRPIKSILIESPNHDFNIEVRVADLFEVSGAVMISTNNIFEANVAEGKISIDSLQGQFTSKYFTGNQKKLIDTISSELKNTGFSSPFPMGTTIPITTHGKTFYWTAMSTLNDKGNASTTLENARDALDGLWKYVREAGELQELAVPVIGTGRGRLKQSRKRVIAIIAESFWKASEENKISDKLIIVIRPEDASNFGVNLYDIKDHLNHVLHS